MYWFEPRCFERTKKVYCSLNYSCLNRLARKMKCVC